MKLKTKYFLLLICSLFFLKAEAKVTLTSIWGDNMVLQQQSEVTFYGKASPGKRVYVSASWNNRKISTVSNQGRTMGTGSAYPRGRRPLHNHFF